MISAPLRRGIIISIDRDYVNAYNKSVLFILQMCYNNYVLKTYARTLIMREQS